MNKYVQEYMFASNEEKLNILRDLRKTAKSPAEIETLCKEAQKIYNRMKGRD